MCNATLAAQGKKGYKIYKKYNAIIMHAHIIRLRTQQTSFYSAGPTNGIVVAVAAAAQFLSDNSNSQKMDDIFSKSARSAATTPPHH